MPTTTERVTILKTVSIFAKTPDDILAEIASLLEEVPINAGETVFEKGEMGTSMYVIAGGRVRVHDGERTLNYLGECDVFGEMALVDSQPRSASVTAVEDTKLLRLDQDPFYRLMDERSEVSRGVIRVLSRHLRARVQDLDDLRTHLEQVILPLGIALSAEENLDRLLERILLEAMSLCNADTARFYTLTEDDRLRFTIVRNKSLNIAIGGTTGREIPLPPLHLYDDKTGDANYRSAATYAALHGRSINIPDIYRAADFDFSRTKAFDKEYSYRSVSCFTVPLKNHAGKVIGVLQLFNAQDPDTGQVIPFDPYQQLVVESLASQAAVALNTRELLRRQEELVRFEHDLQVGRRIQANFLPQELPQPPGWEIAACFQPAREVAGDFYDAFPVAGDRLGLVIADVCDKGVGSALFMALSRSLIRAFGRLDVVPGYQTGVSTSDTEGLLAAINARALDAVKLTSDYVAKTHEDMSMFVTLFFGVLDPSSGTLSYINAGHNSPFVFSPTGSLKAELTPTGPAVGLLPGMNFEIQQTILEPGDLLLTFTDGVTEAQDPHGEFFDEERLVSLVEGPAISVAALLERIEASLQAHMADTEQSDDITMLAVRRAGTSQAPPAE